MRGGVAQVLEHLPSKHDTLSSNSTTAPPPQNHMAIYHTLAVLFQIYFFIFCNMDRLRVFQIFSFLFTNSSNLRPPFLL
jgi:hypothetical protein